MKLVTTKFKSGGLYEEHVVATWNLGNRLSICFWAQGNQEKPVSRWQMKTDGTRSLTPCSLVEIY